MLPPPLIPAANLLGTALGCAQSVADYDMLLATTKAKLAAELEAEFVGDDRAEFRAAVVVLFVQRALSVAKGIVNQRKAAAALAMAPVGGTA